MCTCMCVRQQIKHKVDSEKDITKDEMTSNYYTITVLLYNTQVAESCNDRAPLQADLVHIMMRLVSQVVKALSLCSVYT